MSISPFSARPGTPDTERRRARLVVLLATLGIAASLLAYAVSPTVRHAVTHAAHSVKGAVGNVLDRDKKLAHARARTARPANAHHGKSAPAGAHGTTGSAGSSGSVRTSTAGARSY